MTQKVLCIGATLIDELYFCEETIAPHSSNPAQRSTHIGGVMSNIVQHLALLKVEVALLTALGSDADAVRVKEELQRIGVDVSASVTVPGPTGKYVSVLQPDGSLYVAVCQDPCTSAITVAVLEAHLEYLQGFEFLLADTNLAQPTLQWLIHFAAANRKKLVIEPVSVPKAGKLASLDLNGVFMVTPNEAELATIAGINFSTESEQLDQLLNRGVQNLWLRKGDKGSLMHQRINNQALGVPELTIVDSTGAGDAALAGWLYAYRQGKDTLQCLQYGHSLAFNILLQKGTVDGTINPEKLNQLTHTYYHD
jgi:pseudouridine kinase